MKKITAGLFICAALSACAQAQPPAAPKAAAIEDVEPDVTRQVSAALGQLAMGTLAPEQLTDNLRAALAPQRMAAMGAALKPCGAAPALELLRRTTKGEDRQYLYRAPCGGKAQLVEIDFNKGARINRLDVRPE